MTNWNNEDREIKLNLKKDPPKELSCRAVKDEMEGELPFSLSFF